METNLTQFGKEYYKRIIDKAIATDITRLNNYGIKLKVTIDHIEWDKFIDFLNSNSDDEPIIFDNFEYVTKNLILKGGKND